MKNFIRLFSVFLAISISSLFSACSSVDIKENTIPMAVILPLSKENSEVGNAIKDGMNIATEKVNSSGGINGKKIDLIFFDANNGKKDVSDLIKTIRYSNIKYLHIGLTNESAFEQDVLNTYDDMFINYICQYPPATVTGKNSVRIFINATQEAEIIESFIPKTSNEQKVVVMSVDDAMGKSCGDYLKFQLGTKERKLFSDVFPYGESKFSILAEQMNIIKPNYVIMYGYGNSSANLLNALIAGKYTGVFITNCGLYPNKLYSSNDVAAFEVVTNFSLNTINTEQNKYFKSSFISKFKKEPNFISAYGYDSIILFTEAIIKNPKNPREFFVGKSFDAAIGKINFDTLGDSTSELSIIRANKK